MSASFGIISDRVTQTLHQAINGLDARQRAQAANIANLETPGYQARKVNFEDNLREAYATGDPTRSSISTSQSLAATRLNGSNVDIDFETLASSETVLRQNLVVEALNNKYTLLRTSITG
jgi:flagellar basal-body rod protein FlgB